MEGIFMMNSKEKRINDILIKLISKKINIKDASKLLKLSERQIYRKKKAYLDEGIISVIHKNKGNTNAKSYSLEFKNHIIELYKNNYIGWNFHHFNDTLEDYHNIKVSDSFIYNILTKAGFISPRHLKNSKKKVHPPRNRRENAGELIQVDASKHQWFYNNSEYYNLHGAIDDATGIVTGAFFQKEETMYGYQIILKQTIEDYGIPECLYSDYRTVFQSTKRNLTIEDELAGKQIKATRYGNMLQHLGIDIISTINPMAKGRIERFWKTFQDRLYNEMKKNNVDNIDKANVFLKDFIKRYNSRFSIEINNEKNNFVKIDKEFNFNIELATYQEYAIHKYSYIVKNKKYYIIIDDNSNPLYINTKEKQKVYKLLDGTYKLKYNDQFYCLKEVKKIPTNKKEKTTKSQEEINRSKAHKPAKNHPYVIIGKNRFKKHEI